MSAGGCWEVDPNPTRRGWKDNCYKAGVGLVLRAVSVRAPGMFIRVLIGLTLCLGSAIAVDIPSDTRYFHDPAYIPTYHWIVTPMDGGAKLLTLVGRFGATDPEQQEVPLVSVLRDSLPGGDPQTDRLRYVWLLTYAPPHLSQRLLSAVPFFYWSLDLKENGQVAGMP